MHRQKAFTLIELLVVIAVIAVLMGILMPALSRARKQARGSACLAQLKQWGLIWSMYTQDYDGKFPEGLIDQNKLRTSINFPRGQWVTILKSGWEKNPGILKCPAAVKVYPSTNESERHGGPDLAYTFPEYQDAEGNRFPAEASSYGLNLWVYNVKADLQGRKKQWHWRHVDNMKPASDVPVMLDAMWRGGGPYWETFNAIDPPDKNGEWRGAGHEMKHFAMDRHGGRTVAAVFGDFSARKVKTRELWELKWHKTYNTQRALTQSETWWGPWLGSGVSK